MSLLRSPRAVPKRSPPKSPLRAAVVALGAVALGLFASSCEDPKPKRDESRREVSLDSSEPEARARFKHPSPIPTPTYAARGPKVDGTGGTDDKRLVYLVTLGEDLYSFDPRVAGPRAYRLVGHLDCKSSGTPMSMAIDKHGWAWVFYDSAELFKVSISDASCRPTPYHHPVGSRDLGMGFTAVSPGSKDEQLFVLGKELGLASIAMPSLQVQRFGSLEGGELTGGGDGRLFHFSPDGGLSEIDRVSRTLKPIHTFSSMTAVRAYAFARYAGRFYIFTASLGNTSTTELDPETGEEKIRDRDIGFRVVGAGQSTLVPRSDADAGSSGDFP